MDYIPRAPRTLHADYQCVSGPLFRSLPALVSVHNRNDADISRVQGYKPAAATPKTEPPARRGTKREARVGRSTRLMRRICSGTDRPLLSVQHLRPRAGSAAPNPG